MPKYRLLTKEELTALEKEFVEYLVLNGITAEDWQKMKKEDISKAEYTIELFSDVVFESILRKTKFIEHRGKNFLRIFQCLSEKLVLVAMEANEEEGVNFNDPAFLNLATANPPKSLSVYTANKPFTRNREIEVFEMLQTGCVITDDKLFKTLSLIMANHQ